MKELNEYRAHLMDKLITTANDFRAACMAIEDPFVPLGADDWNVHQIAAHTRDVENLVYGLRARRTAAEDNPEFQNFDGDTYTREHYSANESLQAILDGIVQSIEELVGILRSLPLEAWSRVSRHEKLGSGFTLQTWVERGLAHLEEHLETVKTAK